MSVHAMKNTQSKASGEHEFPAFSYAQHEWLCGCLESLAMAAEINGNALRSFLDAGEELQRNYRKLFSKEMSIAGQAPACHTLKDYFALQNKAMKTWLDNIQNETQKLAELGLKNYTKAIAPVDLSKICTLME